MRYVKPERMSLKLHYDLDERWVHDIIASNPSILGLGDLVLRDRERTQPRAGRLDLLLQDPDSKRRYEVEVMLGATDETHIIRTIEYWDIGRKRYPQYEHSAVLVAEDITSRFLNVVSLFNGAIPLIAIQMQAFRVGDQIALVFTKVVDELTRGLVDEDEDAEAAPTDRSYWEQRGSKVTLQLVDELLTMVRELDPSIGLKYNKFYIGLFRAGQPFNFLLFRPGKSTLMIQLKIPRTDELDGRIEETGIERLEYATRYNAYRLSLRKEDLARKRDFLKDLIKMAYAIRAE